MNDNTTIKTDQDNPSQNHKILKSATLILLLTVIFGVLSYALIQLNNKVMKLPISEGLWCVLAMVLAIIYYLIQKRRIIKGSLDKQ